MCTWYPDLIYKSLKKQVTKIPRKSPIVEPNAKNQHEHSRENFIANFPKQFNSVVEMNLVLKVPVVITLSTNCFHLVNLKSLHNDDIAVSFAYETVFHYAWRRLINTFD